MISKFKAALRMLKRRSPSFEPRTTFQSDHYLRHNARRLEHLASLGIPVTGRTVLELGAGIGDHTHYFLDRQCLVTITEAREENLELLKLRYPGCDIRRLDLEHPIPIGGAPFQVVYCYGVLYHLSDPEKALRYLSECSRDLLLLETCVSFGDTETINPVDEHAGDPTQAYSGVGCRPTRLFVYTALKKYFPFVYVPRTQPNHEEFPLDWTAPDRHGAALSRSIFIGSRTQLDLDALEPDLLMVQTRHP